jgi:hypothetical protein
MGFQFIGLGGSGPAKGLKCRGLGSVYPEAQRIGGLERMVPDDPTASLAPPPVLT